MIKNMMTNGKLKKKMANKHKTVLVWVCLLMLFWIVCARGQSETNLIVNGSFEDWEWVPLASSPTIIDEVQKRLEQKEDINIDYRGPLYQRLVGYGASPGRMVDGPKAYEGKSLYLVNDRWVVAGLHRPYDKLLETGQEYNWEIYLKGAGDFIFKAWIQGLKEGKLKWLGFPELISVKATNKWKCYKGKFKVPVLEKDGSKQEKKVSAAIVIPAKSTIYIDNFRLWKCEQTVATSILHKQKRDVYKRD